MVPIIKDFIPAGRGNRPGKSNPMLYVTIHNTGNTGKGSNAKSHANYLKSDSAVTAQVSWHYTADDREIYQHLPDNENAWHCGDGKGDGNSKSIGIEICMNSDGDLLKATNNAAELSAKLCMDHNIPIANVKQHNNWSGKDCPQMIRSGKPYNWNEFIGKVEKILKGSDIDMEELRALQEKVNGLAETVNKIADLLLPKYGYIDNYMPDWARPTIQKLYNKGYIKGDENGNLQLSYNDLRYYVVNDRAGIYGE